MLCSWCSLGDRVRERADTLSLWRMSAFCLTGAGERPRVPMEFFWHLGAALSPGPVKIRESPDTPPVSGLLHVCLLVSGFLPLIIVAGRAVGAWPERGAGACRGRIVGAFSWGRLLPAALRTK